MSVYSKLLKNMMKKPNKPRVSIEHKELIETKIPINQCCKINDPHCLESLREAFKRDAKHINIENDSGKIRLIWGKLMEKPEKLKNVIHNFEVDKEKGTVTYKKDKNIVLKKDAVGKIKSGIEILQNSNTRGITNTIKLDNYDKQNNTININDNTIDVDDLINMERVLLHTFGG